MKPSGIKPIRSLTSDAARIATGPSETHEPPIITRNREAKLVMQDIASHEAQEQTTALLKILALGQEEMAEGKVTEAEDVFAELGWLDRDAGARTSHG